MKNLIVVLMVAACGGGSAKPAPVTNATTTATAEQTLPVALAQLCSAPTRAKADPEWEKTDAKMPILGKHMEEGVTHPKVVQFLELAKGGGVKDNTELDALLTEAAMNPEQCELRVAFAPAK